MISGDIWNWQTNYTVYLVVDIFDLHNLFMSNTAGMEILNNTERKRFETDLGEEFAFLDYEQFENTIALTHTFVPHTFRHQGIAFALVRFALEYARATHLQVIIGCSTVTIFMETHPEYQQLLIK